MSSETDRIEKLEAENARLKAEKARQDEQRWEEVKANMAHIPAMKDTLDELKIAVNGCPDEPDKGLVVRMDRIEQKSKILGWVTKTALGAAIVAFVGTVYNSLRRGGP